MKLYYKALIMKTEWVWYKDRQIKETQYKVQKQTPRLISDKDVTAVQWRKNGLFSTWSWVNLIHTFLKVNLDLYIIPHTKINSWWIVHLDIQGKTKRQ